MNGMEWNGMNEWMNEWLTDWLTDLLKEHLNSFHAFYLKKYRTEKNVTKCPSNKNIKLLLQRRKSRPEMKASFLFNILGTIADNLSIL